MLQIVQPLGCVCLRLGTNDIRKIKPLRKLLAKATVAEGAAAPALHSGMRDAAARGTPEWQADQGSSGAEYASL